MSISDNLADEFIGYSVDLSRFSSSVERNVIGLLKKLEMDLVSSLNSYDITAPSRFIYRERRLRNLLSSVRETIKQSYNSINRSVSGSLSDLSSLEATSSRDIINNVIGASLATTSLTPEFLASISSAVSIEGAPAKEWWSRQNVNTLNRFKDQIRIGMLQGEGVPELVRRVRGTSTGRRSGYLLESGKQRYLVEFRGGLLDVSTRHATALTRTAVLATSQVARFQMFQENSDVIKGMQALTTLDYKTSLICISRSGYSWTLEGLPMGKTRGRFPGPPPWHFNCRTVLIPVLYSFDEIAGNVSPRKKDQLRGSISQSTQASINGQVAADLNYEGWLSLQSKSRQLDVLGPSRYRLWKDGNIGFSDLVNSAGRPLTIKQLKSKYGGDTSDLTSNLKL